METLDTRLGNVLLEDHHVETALLDATPSVGLVPHHLERRPPFGLLLGLEGPVAGARPQSLHVSLQAVIPESEAVADEQHARRGNRLLLTAACVVGAVVHRIGSRAAREKAHSAEEGQSLKGKAHRCLRSGGGDLSRRRSTRSLRTGFQGRPTRNEGTRSRHEGNCGVDGSVPQGRAGYPTCAKRRVSLRLRLYSVSQGTNGESHAS